MRTKMISLLLACFALAHMTTEGAAAGCAAVDFALEKSASEGVYVNCEHLDNSFGLSLEQCKERTCAVGGNAFNFRVSEVFITQCYPKKCCGVPPYKISEIGGYDVFFHQVADNGCPLNDNGSVIVPTDTGSKFDEENSGHVTPKGCHFFGETHPAGETWIVDVSVDRTKECYCPDPLPEVWSSITHCRGACLDGDTMHYGGESYFKVIDGNKTICRCNINGRETCE